MADDIIDDFLRELRPYLTLDEWHRKAYELRQRWGGKRPYVRADRATIDARKQKSVGFRPLPR